MKRTLLVVGLLLAMPAAAHDWYPTNCCSGEDCAPVDRVRYSPHPEADNAERTSRLPVMWVTTKYGTAYVPNNMTRQRSPDNRMHACIIGTEAGVALVCLFVPRAS